MAEAPAGRGLAQWIEISGKSLVHNLAEFRRLVGPGKKIMAVVKANAYGHGIVPTARILAANGADWLGVHSLEEGRALREAGIVLPILVLGYVPLDSLEEALLGDLRLVVTNTQTIRRLAAAARRHGKKARVHIKLETGTHRQGVAEREVFAFVEAVRSRPELVLEGLSSHYANIEDTTKHEYPRFQMDVFRRVSAGLKTRGIRIPLRHFSCTAATILFPETHFDMARVGIGLYGLWPSKETYLSRLMQKKEPLALEPVLSWKARVAQVKDVPADSFVGYGCTFKTTRRTRLAVVPAGYYDGYGRSLSNSSHVLAHGRRAPVRGRVAMDFLTVDVTDIPAVRIEDVVTLIGRDGGEEVSADDLASLSGTINYEIVSRINPGIPRFVV
jgi:alanine racemase